MVDFKVQLFKKVKEIKKGLEKSLEKLCGSKVTEPGHLFYPLSYRLHNRRRHQ